MPRPATNPILFDEVLQLDIANLKRWGYLQNNAVKSGTLTWSVKGAAIGSISITGNTTGARAFIDLNYKHEGRPRQYQVEVISTSSNLNKGKILYFVCPHTHKRCRKLYFIGGYFLHREAFSGCMYESQTQPKKRRHMFSALDTAFKIDELNNKLGGKYFKMMYAGKPTKRYLELMQRKARLEQRYYFELVEFG